MVVSHIPVELVCRNRRKVLLFIKKSIEDCIEDVWIMKQRNILLSLTCYLVVKKSLISDAKEGFDVVDIEENGKSVHCHEIEILGAVLLCGGELEVSILGCCQCKDRDKCKK